MIVSSFLSQYGLRLSKDLPGMKWPEFAMLLAGLSGDTALGRIITIRSENGRDALKHFTKEQHRIRNEWRGRKAKKVSEAQLQDALNQFKSAFISMAK